MPWISLIAALLMVGVFVGWGPAADALVYDRTAIEQGEHWRWISAHLTHTDTEHLAWNLAGLLLIGWLFEPAGRRRLVLSTLVGMILINVHLAVASPLERYCGLSGALNATLVSGALATGKRRRDRVFACLVVCMCLLKILVEGATQTALFSDTAWPPVPAAHFAGWLGGLGFAAADCSGRGGRRRAGDPARHINTDDPNASSTCRFSASTR